MEIKYCGSSTVTNNKQKHSQNVMVNIFSSGYYAPYICIYIYNIIAARLQASPVFDLLLFCRLLHSFSLQLHVDVDYPVQTITHVNCI